MSTEKTEKQPAPPKPPLAVGGRVAALIPQTIDEAARLAQGFVQSGMVPDSYKIVEKVRDEKQNEVEQVNWGATQARVLIGIMKGMEVGLPPVAALSTIYIVNNRPTVFGDGALALLINSDKYEWHKEVITGETKKPDWTATCTIKRRGIEEPIVRTFTWQMAIDASLTGKAGPWKNYPARQMQMRARAFAIRDGFADVMMGLGIAEEVNDYNEVKPTPPPASNQQDAFTMKALADRTDENVDFSLMGKANGEPVPVGAAEPEQATTASPTAQRLEVVDQPVVAIGPSGAVDVTAEMAQAISDAEKASPSPYADNAFPGCKTCSGKGLVVFEETDQTTGEITEGKQPCPECSPAPAAAKPKAEAKDTAPRFDLDDLIAGDKP